MGSDRVLPKGDAIVVEAACEMPEWKVTRYRKAAVVFEERVYFVAARTALRRGAWRYVLEPWPEDLHDRPGATIYYDEAYVRARDEARSEQARVGRKAIGLLFVAWLLGFLFSGVKLRLNERYGIDPITATEQSVFIQRPLFLGLSALLMFSAIAGILPVLPLLATVVVVLVDLVVRSDRLLRGGLRQYGFCEWMFRRLPKD